MRSDKKVKNGSLIDLDRFRALKDRFGTDMDVSKQTGIDRSLVNYHYNGKRNISLQDLIKYAQCFNVSVDYLLGIEKDDKSDDETTAYISDYTGLSIEAVNRLHRFAILDFQKISKYVPSMLFVSGFVKLIDSLICDLKFVVSFDFFMSQKGAADKFPVNELINIYKALAEYNFDDEFKNISFSNSDDLDTRIDYVCDKITRTYLKDEDIETYGDINDLSFEIKMHYGIVEYTLQEAITDFIKSNYLTETIKQMDLLKKYESDWNNKYGKVFDKYGDTND